jgi:hypothetical protein
MGITHDQQCRATARKLAGFVDTMAANFNEPTHYFHGDGPSRRERDERFDAAAWAFTGTLTRSDEAASLMGSVAWAFENAVLIDDFEPEGNEVDPRDGLHLLRQILRAYRMMTVRDCNQWDGSCTGYDCAREIERWKGGHRDALLYLDEDDLGLDLDIPDTFEPGWMRDLALLHQAVPEKDLRKLLRAQREEP